LVRLRRETMKRVTELLTGDTMIVTVPNVFDFVTDSLEVLKDTAMGMPICFLHPLLWLVEGRTDLNLLR